MRRIAIIAALLSSWSGLPVVGQAPSTTSDVAPATVVRLPSASLGREQVATDSAPRELWHVAAALSGHVSTAWRWPGPHGVRDARLVSFTGLARHHRRDAVGRRQLVREQRRRREREVRGFRRQRPDRLRGRTLPDDCIPRGSGRRGCLDGGMGCHDARSEAPSTLRRGWGAQRPIRHFETGPEHGHDVADAAALRCARDARASRAGPRDSGVDDSS